VDTASDGRSRERLFQIQDSLQPKITRDRALAGLDEIFRGGSVPEPSPDGFKRGEFVTMSVARPSDAAARTIASLYMPWLGKSFDREAGTGRNVLKPGAKTPMSIVWRNYAPELERVDRIEAFPFRTRVAAGEVDPDLQVLKIDYDFEANPSFLIRRILDELVQIDEGLYLGKILFRTKRGWRPIGFFSLHD